MVSSCTKYSPSVGNLSLFFKGGTILTTTLLLRKVSNYYILKAKAPTAKPFVDICPIEQSFHILESRPYLISHVITTEKET